MPTLTYLRTVLPADFAHVRRTSHLVEGIKSLKALQEQETERADAAEKQVAMRTTERDAAWRDRQILHTKIRDLESRQSDMSAPEVDHAADGHTHPELATRSDIDTETDTVDYGVHVENPDGTVTTRSQAADAIAAAQQEEADLRRPTAPQNVRTIGWPHATVSWDPPKHLGVGDLDYTVLLTPEGEGEQGVGTVLKHGTRSVSLNWILRGKPGSVRIMASTPYGRAYSDSVTVGGRPKDASPSAPRNLRMDGEHLKWDPPILKGAGGEVYYAILASQDGKRWSGVGSHTFKHRVVAAHYKGHFRFWKVQAHNKYGSADSDILEGA